MNAADVNATRRRSERFSEMSDHRRRQAQKETGSPLPALKWLLIVCIGLLLGQML